MKRILPFTLILLPILLLANPVGKNTAIKVSLNFMQERAEYRNQDFRYSVKATETYMDAEGNLQIYAINLNPQGFVLIAADDAAYPILAYSYEGSWKKQDDNPGTALWIAQYQTEIREIRDMNKRGYTLPKNPVWDYYLKRKNGEGKFRSVDPMLTSTWDQGYPYNQQCPSDPGGVVGHAVVGCVATACAQLMYYFRFPEHGSGSYSYYHPSYDTISVNFANATYEWDKMTDYTYSYNEEIAEISYHFGVSVDMVYGPSSSGMYNHKAAYSLRTHFNYSPETQYVYRDSTNMDWDSLLVTHLDRKIPMYYAGWAAVGSNSGHAFIADGYEITPQGNHYHFNWGWGGTMDGYFYTNNLTPGGAQFTFAQELIINAYPDTVNFTYPQYCSGPGVLNGKVGTIDDGSGPTRDYPANANCSWLIQPQANAYDSISYITIDFTRFNTEAGQDILTIYDGSDATAPLIGTFSGQNLPAAVSSTGNSVFITFSTDGQNNDAGFFLAYESIAPEYCVNLDNVTTPSGNISDGSGSKYYNNNILCRWLIEPPSAVSVTIDFSEFNTQQGKDILKIYDWGSQTLLGEFSGDQLPPILTAASGSMYLEFTTDAAINSDGWSATYTASAAGLYDMDEAAIRLWPNPAEETFFYELPESLDIENIRVIALSGQVLTETANIANLGRVPLDGMGAGIHIVEFSGKNARFFRKLVVR